MRRGGRCCLGIRMYLLDFSYFGGYSVFVFRDFKIDFWRGKVVSKRFNFFIRKKFYRLFLVKRCVVIYFGVV